MIKLPDWVVIILTITAVTLAVVIFTKFCVPPSCSTHVTVKVERPICKELPKG